MKNKTSNKHKMKTTKILNRVKEGEILTFTNLTVYDLVKVGWYFNDNDNDNGHENFYLDYMNGEFRLCAVSTTNDSYTIVNTTEGLGGIEGVIELIEKFDNSFDLQWVAEFGFINLK